MNVRLVVERRRRRVWTAELRNPESTIGRALGSTVRIPSSEVSRLHCRLRVENGMVTVEDLESVNGTLVNGQRVRGVQTVRPGDRLTVGPVTFVVEYELAPQVMDRLRGQNEFAVLDADDEVEVVEAADEVEVVEAVPEEVIPVARKGRPAPVEEVEVVAAEEDEEIVFEPNDVSTPASGGDLRDILMELDETADYSQDDDER